MGREPKDRSQLAGAPESQSEPCIANRNWGKEIRGDALIKTEDHELM